MSENKTICKRTNKNQFEKLVELMESNPNLARGVGEFGSSKKNQKEYWDQFATTLNSLGPPTRDGKEWHKVWLDYKLKIKRKLSMNKAEVVATGGGKYSQVSLTPLEQAVDELLGLEQAVRPEGMCFGSSHQISEDLIIGLQDIEVLNEKDPGEADTQKSPPPPLTAMKRTTMNENSEKERLRLLQGQTATQTELVKIEKEKLSFLSDIARFSRKSYEIQREKLALLKAAEKRKEKENFDKNRRHAEYLEMETKKHKLEMLKFNLKN
ncbi:uncharacterized protein LOC129947881 [Eupeodes corollae]|uniref:uncharacterized protein LOC129947881 n=1 Tax=Eupeodes corollae TaxID=290404 RepID=UPI002490BE99|nr:uncharacterized protein LOC129947881 [Eupeodes corollae]